MRYPIISTNDGRKWETVDMAETWEKHEGYRAANPNKSFHIIPA